MVAFLRKGAGPAESQRRFRAGKRPNWLFRPVGFRLPGPKAAGRVESKRFRFASGVESESI